MSTSLQLRGGTSTEHVTFVGANREVTVDTSKKTLIVHDGVTAGGHELAKKSDVDSALELVEGLSTTVSNINITIAKNNTSSDYATNMKFN